MALKFRCENCGKDIAVRFLTVGEAAKCKSCGTSNSVPESAEEISDEAAERMIKAPVSEAAEGIGNEPTKSLPIAKALWIIGILSIGFGVFAGIVMLISFSDYGFEGGLSLGGVVIALGMTFFYCSLGVICLGIARVLELLNK